MSKREGIEPPNREELPTPPPVVRDSAAPEPIGGSESRRERFSHGDLSGRRGRTPGPPERSGPIGIASGDFSTPVIPKRTTTQPRLPVVTAAMAAAAAAAAAAPSADDAPSTQAAVVTPPPPVNGRPPPPPTVGAEPEVPFAAPPPLDLREEAALLAAEAAAVRALDSGPITPPPVVDDPGPTPPPDPGPTPPPDPALARALKPRTKETPLHPVPAPTPAPEARRATPSPAPDIDPESLAAGIKTPPPLPVPASVEAKQAEPTPPLAPEPELTPSLTPSPAAEIPAPAPSAPAGAIPSGTIDSEVSARPSEPELAPTPPPAGSEEDAEVAGDDDLEVMEGGDTAVDAVPGTSPTLAAAPAAPVDGAATAAAPPPPPAGAAAAQRTPPPPIPGKSLKTPAPEVRGEMEAAAPPPVPSLPRTGVPPLPILPEALAQRPRRPKRSKPWFEEVFDEDYLRTLPFMTSEQTLREVEFIERSLELPAGSKVLDIGCGYGRHAIELVHRGLNITGLDLSLPLLIRAADEAQRRALSVNFVHADMREMVFEDQFDGAYSMLTSFGYFDEEANLRVAEGIARAVRPGGRFLLDVVNRDYIVADLPSRVWWEGNGCVVLEEVDFNFHTSRVVTHRSIVFEDGRQLEQEISIRAYSLHELGRLLRQAGFRVIDISGGLATRGNFFGSTSRNLLVLAERRTDES